MEPEVVDDSNAQLLLSPVKESPSAQCYTATELSLSNSEPFSLNNHDAAHNLLIELREVRKIERVYRPPEAKKRNYLLLPKQRRLKINKAKHTFRLHEVAKALDHLLAQVPLIGVGIAQALLSHAPSTTLDELYLHLHDPKLEGRMKRRFGGRSASSNIPETTWLDEVTRQGSTEYIRLFCQTGLAQAHIDRAFGIALTQNSMNAMETLLSCGAIASAYQEHIREHIKLKDTALVELLLSYPTAMSLESWQICVGPEVEALDADGNAYPNILLMCLSQQPGIACESLLFNALESQNIRAVELLVPLVNSDDIGGVHQHACELTSRIEDNSLRHDYFTILAKSGFLADRVMLREELMKDVKARQIPLIRTLVDAGVKLDVEPNNVIYWTVSQLDFALLELLKDGNFSPPVAPILYYAPESASETDMLRLIEFLEPRGLEGEPIDSHLVLAVQAEQHQLITTLLRLGASVEFEQASVIKEALKHTDLRILNTLLERECSPEILSAVIPTAMALEPKPRRRTVMAALTQKGVMGHKLSVPLQSLVREEDVDCDLIQLLLQHQASVDGIGNGIESPISLATRRGNLSLLALLCQAGPQIDTSSTAVPIALGLVDTWGDTVALKAIEILLKQGAAGVLVHQTLLASIEKDRPLPLAKLLLEYGADANHSYGASYGKVIQKGNIELLEILCSASSPNQASLKSTLPIAVDLRYYTLTGLQILLRSGPWAAAAIDESWTSEEFRKVVRCNPHLLEVVSCFFRHGMDVNLGDGTLLCFAIREENIDLLGRILRANPNITSLKHAFRDAILVEARDIELELMRLLLEQAGSAEIGQSQELLTETAVALTGDCAGLKLLLRHRAKVDHDDGAAVLTAAIAGSVEVLDLLLLAGPAYSTIKGACLMAAAAARLSIDLKFTILSRLVTANGGLSTGNASDLLATSISRLPDCSQLPKLLLARGATVDFASLLVALGTACQDLFRLLLRHIKNPDTMTKLFRAVRGNPMDNSRELWVYKDLLRYPIPINEISEALIGALAIVGRTDLSVPKLLLEHGAAVEYGECTPFSLALKSNSPRTVKLLCRYLPNNTTAAIAFELTRNAVLHKHVRLEAYRCLLQWDISRTSIQGALVDILASSGRDVSIVRLLLEKGADPNENKADCFLVAIRAAAETEFRALSKYADTSVLLPALLGHFTEDVITHWFGICLAEQERAVDLDHHDFLTTCMRRFPRGHKLLHLLLENGLSPASELEYSLCVDWPAETCTALIWAVFSREPRIDNVTILTLLRKGGKSALPAYSTSRTRVSAAFGCLLDKSRTPVLEALLELDRGRVMSQKMLGTDFGYLAAHPTRFEERLSPSSGEIFLREASICIGNFDAYQVLLNGEETPNDGGLHFAAYLALPKFVQWFLKSDDANRGHENYVDMIPLAVACQSKPMPWCKIANMEGHWTVRLKMTMQLLAPMTDFSLFGLSCKTPLHIAIETGPNMTEILIDSVKIYKDKQRNERYLCKDNAGLFYSPDQWVTRVLAVDAAEKPALLKSLKGAKLQSRFYREVEPAAGQQPPGYTGLPPRYAELWKAHEKMLAERQSLAQ
ncbi:hypothetical protein F5Y05DRAFT_393950 [Hypoxylon sp. FL0543]|nr:hypothetical protein F5Y05DRAFT_393950 [Hypoxylon sp. FL0543]